METLEFLDQLASFIWKYAIVVFSIVWVYEGTRIIVAGGPRRRALKFLIPGILVMVLMASLSFWISHTMKDLSESLVLKNHTELPESWGTDKDPETREKASRSYASVIFTGSGKIVKYFDHSGVWKTYCPTTKDIDLREQAVLVKSQTLQLVEESYSSIFIWLVYGVFATILGWSSGRKNSKGGG